VTTSVNYLFSPSGAAATLTGTSANDIMIGGAAADTFVFNANFGHDTVTNYAPNTDILQFAQDAIFTDVAALLAATHDDAHGNAVITHDAGNTVTLAGVSTATLQAADQSHIHIV
jgi:serralysin